MARQGFMLYHEDLQMLKHADDSTLASFIRNLTEFSVGLDEAGEIPTLQTENGMLKALYDSMVQKIIRDNEKYVETIKEQSIKRKMGHLQDEYKAKGIKKTKEQIRIEAEEWYTREYHGIPQNTTVNPGILQNSNCNVTETVTETQKETLSLTGTVAERSEAVSPETQQVYDCVKNQGIPLKTAVLKLLDESIKNHGEGKTILAVLQNPDFHKELEKAAVRG